MIGAIAVVSVAIWFYFTARRLGENAVKWAIYGILNYYVPAMAWYFLVTRPLLESLGVGSKVLTVVVGYSFILVGLAVAALARSRLLVRGREIPKGDV